MSVNPAHGSIAQEAPKDHETPLDDTLAKVERIPYWGMAAPGDEAWLPPTTRP
jgi:hypothetical protein